jgi:hypothetical protein
MQTIDKQISITPLDGRFNKCLSSNSAMQLEIYYSLEQPDKKIGVISPSTGQYTFKTGARVDVTPRIIVNNYCYLTNVVRTDFLTKILTNQR